MNFLAVDTSGKSLTAIAFHNGEAHVSHLENCFHDHSVRLMGEIDGVLKKAGIAARDCDFFAAVTGPGSFTGIRIGVSTVKGLCLALEKPALAVTSFDTVAYAEKGARILALVDAGHGAYYACAYRDGEALFSRYCTGEEVLSLIKEGYTPLSREPLAIETKRVNPAKGLLEAALAGRERLVPADMLAAFYLRKSSAEEGR